MTFELLRCETTDDVHAAISPIWHYFGMTPNAQSAADFAQLMTPSRMMMAVDRSLPKGAQVVGGSGSFAFDLTIPGGHVRASGLSMVGVLPSHRRRGILTAMIHRALDDCRRRQEPVAYLWASEEQIYARFGFGLSALSGDIELSRDHAAFVAPAPASTTVRRITIDSAQGLLSKIYTKVVSRTPGAFPRSSDWWRIRSLADPSWRRKGGGEMQCAVVDIDGAPSAYALYRINSKIQRGIQAGGVEAIEVVGVSPAATYAAWRFLCDMDWTSSIKGEFLPLDHPLLLLAAEPRHLNFRQRDGAWLRIVDLERALAARAFGPGDPIVIEVADELCPGNAGRWSVGAGRVVRTEQAPDLRCDVSALANIYLGGFTWGHLVAASRATATDDEAVLRADRVFERRGAPWCPEVF